jgi:L-lactate dehydrogenase complex protein LldF
VLRAHFLSADMGISGGNFLVAETGSVAHRHQRRQRPHGHHAAARARRHHRHREGDPDARGPRHADAHPAALGHRPGHLQLHHAAPPARKRPGDTDGPEHMYFMLVDNGRIDLLGGDFQDMLRCIRCGACMNHCPVYQTAVGGHAYGWVYPGPMGSVLTPLFVGIENALDLPQAATLCNQCGVGLPGEDSAARS